MISATVTEIATALIVTKQAIHKRIDSGDWKTVNDKGVAHYDITKIGLTVSEQKKVKKHLQQLGLELVIEVLPEKVCPLPNSPPAVVPAAPLTTVADLEQWQRETMDARLFLMRVIDCHPGGPTSAMNQLEEQAHSGTLPVELQALIPLANGKQGAERTISAKTLTRWRGLWLKDGKNPLALAPKKRETALPVWAPALEAFWRQGSNPALPAILEDMAEQAAGRIKIPSYGQARRYLQSLGEVEREKGRKTGISLENLKPHRRRDTSTMYPGDAYTADGHCFDAEWAHPFTGKPFRPEITPVLDIVSRKCVGWSIDMAESGLAVLDALRIACELYGPPVYFYTDNGKGYKNQMLTAEGTGILSRLGIVPKYSRPRNPKAHGISERGHRTILVKAAKQLCSYIGAAMDPDVKQLVFKATRRAIKLAATEPGKIDGKLVIPLIEFDLGVKHVDGAMYKYNDTPHSGLPAYRDPDTRVWVHLTPNQAWELGIEKMKRELPQDEWLAPATELPDLYHPMIERTCRNGEIKFGRKHNGLQKRYFNAALKEYHGKAVYVAYSPADPDKVWVRDKGTMKLLAIAKLEGNLDPYFVQSQLEEDRQERGKNQLKRIDLKRADIEAEMRGPEAVVIEHAPQLQEVRRQLQLVVAGQLPVSAPKPPVFTLPPTQRGKYRYWCDIDARIKAGEELLPEESNFHLRFPNTTAWQAERTVEEEFAAMRN